MKSLLKQVKKGSIREKMLIGMLALGLVLILGIGLLVYYQCRARVWGRYEDLAFSYTRTLSDFIDGDRIKDYLDGGEKDSYYEVIQRLLDSTLAEVDLVYYSVIVPSEEGVTYVWDGNSSNDPSIPGFTREYFAGEREKIEAILSGVSTEELYFFKRDSNSGLYIAYTPIFNSNKEVVAIAEADFSTDYIKVNMTEIMLWTTLGMVFILIGLTLYGIFMSRMITEPILKLDTAASNLVYDLKTDQPFETDIHTGDEIETLAHSFEQMNKEMRTYIRENNMITVERERLGTELALAAKIQKDMLPGDFPAFPEKEEFDIFASMSPAREVGGDFYDFFLIDDRHLALVIADVSGKGIPAALFMMKSMITIKNSALSGNSPKEVLEEANKELCRNNQEQMFVTVWFGILDLDSGVLTASNGGHEYPVYKAAGSYFELLKDRHGFLLGGMDGMRYTEYEICMEPGASLFVYTDGVPEAAGADQQLFGLDRMVASLNRDPDASPRVMLENVDHAVADFVRGAPQYDDLTMMCIRYNGKPKTDPEPLQVLPELSNISVITAFVKGELEKHGWTEKAMDDIFIIIDELFGNIVKHAENKKMEPVTFSLAFEDDGSLRMTIIDSNPEFNPLGYADPNITLPAKSRKAGGLGIFIVKKKADKIRYEYKDGKNILEIRKYLKKEL